MTRFTSIATFLPILRIKGIKWYLIGITELFL